MARIIKEIQVSGRKLTALFDTGSINTYIREEVALPNRVALKYPFRVGLGGERREIREVCILEGEIEGLGFSTDSYLIDDLGSINGKPLDIIIGARTMEGWEIRLDPKTGELDLSGLRKREFTEY
ncbi:MAG: hypothetical protein ACOYU0_04220 [Nitrospirota bacterium]